jgi:uncharacterized protein
MTETNLLASGPPPTVPRQASPSFLFTCTDGPGSGPLRTEHLDGHLRHVEAHWQRYVVAGPVREPGGTALVGSVFIVLAADADEAWTLMRGDPYITCGMYASITCHDLTLSVGLFPGGKIWESADAIRHRATGG